MAYYPTTTILSLLVYEISDYDQFSYEQCDYNLSDASLDNTSQHYRQSTAETLIAKELDPASSISTTRDFKADSCESIFDVYVNIFLCFVGFLGNSVTIAVLRRDRDPQRQKSTNWLLEALAVADTIFLVFAFIFWPIKRIAFRTDAMPTVRNMFPFLKKYVYPLAQIANFMTIWIVVFVSVDRYLVICKPLHPEWRSMRRVKMAVVLLFILAVIFNIPYFFEMDVIFKKSGQGRELRRISCRRAFVKNVYYKYIYETGCDFLFRSVGPLVILVILNVRLFLAIKALNKKIREMTRQAKEEKSLTVMLIIVVIIFVICQLPMSVLSITFRTTVFFPDETAKWKATRRCSLKVARALVVFNSSINFFVYCLIWRKFNRIFVRMMACCKKEANGLIQRTESTTTRFLVYD